MCEIQDEIPLKTPIKSRHGRGRGKRFLRDTRRDQAGKSFWIRLSPDRWGDVRYKTRWLHRTIGGTIVIVIYDHTKKWRSTYGSFI